MGRVVGFELNSQDPEKAAKFYSDVFGWKSLNHNGIIGLYLRIEALNSPELMAA